MSDNVPAIITTSGFALTAAEQMSTALWRSTIDNRYTQPQFLALCGLYHKPGIGHYSLADMLGIDRATIGPILKKLIDQKLINRSKDPQDSRRSVLTLQPVGEAALAEMVDQVKSVDSQLMAPLSLSEQAALIQSWAILAEHVMQKDFDAPVENEQGGIPSLKHYPWFFLRQACRHYRRLWRDLVDENISSSLFALMDVVATYPHIDIRGAALRASIEESNAVRMVMRLVRTHMMRDPRDPNDARRTLLSLTETGATVHATLLNRLGQVQKALTRPLPPMAVPEFHRLTCQVARLSFNGDA